MVEIERLHHSYWVFNSRIHIDNIVTDYRSDGGIGFKCTVPISNIPISQLNFVTNQIP